MHDNHKLIEARLSRVLKERVRPAVYGRPHPLTVTAWHVSGEPVPVEEGLDGQFAPFEVGQEWGRAWATTWFRFRAVVPKHWASSTVEARIDLGFDKGPGFTAEGMAYLPDATPLKGLHPDNQWLRIADHARGGEEVDFYVEAAANPTISTPVTWLGDTRTAPETPLYCLRRAELAVFDATVWELVHDLEVLQDLMTQLSLDDPRRHEILRTIGAALDVIDVADVPGSAAEARAVLEPALQSPAHASAHQLSAVGHAHIDSAWLWPLRETVRKVARTTANTVDLMDRYPEYVFAMSQAQQLAWLAQHYPTVYENVKRKIELGQFVPVGSMWVEADTNMPGSEAMARQFSYGKRFYLDEFGIDTQEVWLPDSFGYSAALPQLVKLSGSKWFLTQKLSWSQTNKFPHHTFWWEGLDGSRVFTHFPPVDTYNATLRGHELAHAVRNFQEKGAARRSLVPFGHGDGGGGATREMLARARRVANLEGSAQVTVETPAAFFARAEAEYRDAPVWWGELYLEFHRGTYTSQATTKQGNRRSEHLLREAELWAATAAVYSSFDYPYETLERIWKTVLLHQFHDILPGSSIAWVHREAAETYSALARELEGVIAAAQAELCRGDGSAGTVTFNPAPHPRLGVPAGGAGEEDRGDTAVVVTESENGWLVDNGLLRVRIDSRGLMTSIFDIENDRECVPEGDVANLLQLHPDLPNRWDAWDIDEFYRNRVTDLVEADTVTLAYAGHERVILDVVRVFGDSRLTQRLIVEAGTKRVDVDTTVDWHETETLLKASFPVDVRAEYSSAETQFGHVKRPTHTNTTWDAAKFEICAHRFLHVGEPDWGTAVVNDSSYGHDVTRTVRDDGGTTTTMRLSLLRAPRYPDPETDQGTHRMRYGFVPGAAVLDAVTHGYDINLPSRRQAGSPVEPLVRSDNATVVIESVKLADDTSGDLVVRLYEAVGARASATVSVNAPVHHAREVDLLERELPNAEYAVDGDSVSVRFRPFQILTLRFTLAS